MDSLAVNVTAFSRNLSYFLNQVQYRGQVLDIERGKRVVARVSPVAAIKGYPIAQLDALLARGPRLNAADRKMMVKDLRAMRAQTRSRTDPWAA